MEGLKKQRIADFLRISDGSGFGWGYGSGSGYGSGYGGGGGGDGDGCGYGYGYGYGGGGGGYGGDGVGYGSGSGSGYCSVFSSGGYGYGSVHSGGGDGDGCGYGYGYCYGYVYGGGDFGGDGFSYIKSFCGKLVYMIDDVPTIIDRITSGIAKGHILRNDLTTTPCFVVKGGGYFAHGVTLRDAMDALREKQLENMPEDERIDAFIKAHEHGKQYPCSDFYDWHHRLTGSCEMGRVEFAKEHGIDIEHDSMTVDEFIDITRDAYGGTIIKKLEKAWNQEG